jgi:leucyl-tRNA synthetase
MDTFVDSSWYFLRYTDPYNDSAPFDRGLVDFWLPVNQYIGGIDHAKGHLLYSRFFVKVLNDIGLLGFREPFQRLFHQGWVKQGGSKMSKSKGNVTGPDDLIAQYGADATRLSILFLGPADQDMDWTPEGVEGMVRFVRRLWRVVGDAAQREPSPEGVDTPLARKAHETIARVTDDIGRRFVFNTPTSAVMELVNELSRAPEDPAARFAAETAVSLIQPYAPHVAEELWAKLGYERLWTQPWPVADERLLTRDTVQLVLQVNGKVRDRIEVPAGLSEEELIALAKASEKVRAHLNGGGEPRAFVVPDKLVNLVV